MNLLLIILLMVVLLDVLTTDYALEHTSLREMNPILRMLIEKLGIHLGLLGSHLVLFGLLYYYSSEIGPYGILGAILIFAAASINNALRIRNFEQK